LQILANGSRTAVIGSDAGASGPRQSRREQRATAWTGTAASGQLASTRTAQACDEVSGAPVGRKSSRYSAGLNICGGQDYRWWNGP
jgi:hypothetical protein